jgi:hypothetical protein
MTRVNDLDGDSAILKSLKKNVTSLVLRGDNVYKGDEYNDLFKQIARLEFVVHLRLLNLGTRPERWHCVKLEDCTQYFLNRMASQLKSLVMDEVHFLVEECDPQRHGPTGLKEFGDLLKTVTNCQRLEFRNDS